MSFNVKKKEKTVFFFSFKNTNRKNRGAISLSIVEKKTEGHDDYKTHFVLLKFKQQRDNFTPV